MSSKRIDQSVPRDLFVLEDEDNPRRSKATRVYPPTILDQVFDQLSPTKETLREILENLKQEIITGGKGNIVFPVVTVNGKDGDVIIIPNDIGLGRVDNTRDMDKPLSIPQKEAIMSILKEYDFNINLEDLYNHIMNMNNPHGVTIEQLNTDDMLASFIKKYIDMHNSSTRDNIHMDIRRSLSKLWNRVDDIDNSLEDRIHNVLECLDEHLEDENAHFDIMSKKEDIVNKVKAFSLESNNDHTKYPTTKAVVEFVANRIAEYENSSPDINNWIDDIKVIDDRSQLPSPSFKYYRKAYFIRNGVTSYHEIAICRIDANNKTYSWDISQMGSYSKFNDNHFVDTIDGLSINMSSVVDAILDENGALDSSLSKILEDYYRRDQIDEFHFINEIKIIPGTMDGTIRYYINNDLTTMSSDVAVSGLKRIAYLEWITENEIWDKAIHSRHIIDRAVETRHIQDKAVTPEKLSCEYGYMLGNTINPGSTDVTPVKLMELADQLRPLIGGWPDPNTPGGNPWYDMISDQIIHPHLWTTGIEYSLGDKSYAQRFIGTISVVPNMDIKTLLTNSINIRDYKIIDAGGTWVYQSDPEEQTILGGSNITGHTFGTVTMDKNGVYFETISTGDRFEAPYDIWIKYTKNSEMEEIEDGRYQHK